MIRGEPRGGDQALGATPAAAVEPGTVRWSDADGEARDEIRSLLGQVTTKLTKETRHTGHKDAVAAQKKAQDLRARVRRDQMDRDQRLARARGELVAYPA